MIPALEDEACVGKTELQQTDDVLYCHGCSLLEFLSSSSGCLMMLIAGLMGTDVNKALTS